MQQNKLILIFIVALGCTPIKNGNVQKNTIKEYPHIEDFKDNKNLNPFEYELLKIIDNHIIDIKYPNTSEFNSDDYVITVALVKNNIENCYNVKLSNQLKRNPSHYLSIRNLSNYFFKYKDFICVCYVDKMYIEEFPNLFSNIDYVFTVDPNLTIGYLDKDLYHTTPVALYYLRKNNFEKLGIWERNTLYYYNYDPDNPEF